MFESLIGNFSGIFDRLKGSSKISLEDLDKAMREIKVALLEADVSINVAKDFTEIAKKKIIGDDAVKSIPNIPKVKIIIKMVNDSLIELLGSKEVELNLKSESSPAIAMMVGLQGAGKTTTTAKLALSLKKKNKKVLIASLDTYRPAAQKQLETLAQQSNISILPTVPNQPPLEIATRALKAGEKYDVLILDTAGRTTLDLQMVEELKSIKSIVNPIEILLVSDAMMGQVSANIAKSFNEMLDNQLTGIILTRMDGDARGGAALSMKSVTGCPIKFISTGEKLSDLEIFYPERIAQRILGMGDVISLVEKATEIAGKEELDKLQKKVQKGQFDFNDLLKQLKTLNKMGGLSSILNFIPSFGKMKEQVDGAFDDKKINKYIAIIGSMNLKERKNSKILNGSRKSRIAKGAGVNINDVNMLIKQYNKMSGVVNKFSKIDHKKLKASDIMNILKAR